MSELQTPAHRFGLVAIVGRPNVGKSTLLNALLGQRLSITSKKPQTTRHRILGIDTQNGYQIAYVDTPGYQTRHGGTMNKLMNRSVMQAVTGVEVIVWVIEAGKLTAADEAVFELLPKEIPLIIAMNKVDLGQSVSSFMPFVAQLSSKFPAKAYIPIAAEKRRNVDMLRDEIAKYLPEGEAQYSADDLTDRPSRFLAAERIREKVFRLVGDEIPFGCAVEIEQWQEEKNITRISAAVIVERDSHKGIILGAGGGKMRRIATEARQDLEELLGVKIFLEVWVKVRANWRESAASLKAQGIE